MTGTSLAQIFSLVLMPLVSRLYSPSDMGEYALYAAIISILGLLGTCRLDLAIMLVDDDDEGSQLVWLGLISALVSGVLVFFGLWAFRGLGVFPAWTALSVTCVAGVELLVNWHSRKRDYRLLAVRTAGEKLLVLILGIALGVSGYNRFGLVAAQAVGLTFSFIYMLWFGRLTKWHATTRSWRTTLAKFSDFPEKTILSTLLTSLAIFLPSILFSIWFEKAQLGQYSLATRVFEIPINLFGWAFATVYYQHSSNLTKSDRIQLFWKSLKGLSLLFAPAFVIAAIWGAQIFSLVFGATWNEAGQLAVGLAPFTAMRLFYLSQSTSLLVQRKLNLDLAVSTLLFLTQMSGFAIGYLYFGSVRGCVMVMCSMGLITYTVGLGLIYRTLHSNQ